MSETIQESMYDRYPYEKRRELDRPEGVLKRSRKRIQAHLRKRYLRWYYNWNSIADQRLDFSKLTKFTNEFLPEGGPLPWLDRPEAPELVTQRLNAGEINKDQAELAKRWMEDGYVILKGVIDLSELDRIWETYERAVFDGKVPIEVYQKGMGDLFLGRCLDAHVWVPQLRDISHHPKFLETASFLLGVKAVPFQTIIGFAGSEQSEHSDSIHMSTYPLGYMTAAWVAFEDIHPDSGPLVYYPKSHRLSYLFSRHLPKTDDLSYKRGRWYNDHYEPRIKQLIEEHDLKPKYLDAKKGDVLFWHANLIHGGSRRENKSLSRRAIVAHYFGKGAFCYSDRNETMVNIFQG